MLTPAVAGCLGGEAGAPPAPVDLSGQKRDDQGGMVIGQHGGPNGQIFYENNSPERHDNPAWFHTLSYGLFQHYFEHEQRGWSAEVIYATDYSVVDDPVTERGETLVTTAPTAPETFADAETLTYVVESEVRGGMGPDLLPFSESADADTFVEEHGGRTMRFDDVTPQFLSAYTG
jgi:nitrous oxide reductase accessory protein NosL